VLNEDLRIIHINNAIANAGFEGNYIRTTSYTLISFPVLALAYQFMRFSNCYFLLITVMSCIPQISPVSPVPQINAMVFVLAISMIREGIEDWGRYKQDKEQNKQKVSILNQAKGVFEDKCCKDLRVGQFVLLRDDEAFPADLALLASSKEQGECFISTSSLDGEKNLKKRVQPKDLNQTFSN
jgi:magnesium-transporting ATPase (P-type)